MILIYFEEVLLADARNVPCKTYRRIYNRQFPFWVVTQCGCVRSSVCPPHRGVIFRLTTVTISNIQSPTIEILHAEAVTE
jgi:hypothetical protein